MIKNKAVERKLMEEINSEFPECEIVANCAENALCAFAHNMLWAIESKGAQYMMKKANGRKKVKFLEIAEFATFYASCEIVEKFFCPRCFINNVINSNHVVFEINETLTSFEVIGDFDGLLEFIKKVYADILISKHTRVIPW